MSVIGLTVIFLCFCIQIFILLCSDFIINLLDYFIKNYLCKSCKNFVDFGISFEYNLLIFVDV